MTKSLVVFFLLSLLAGCASTPRYACGLPKGVGCKPVGEVYQASLAGTLARNRPGQEEKSLDQPSTLAKGGNTAVVATVKPSDPLLSPPKQIRVWIKRWEDATGDLHDETYLYLRLDNGAWRLTP
ncbi:MAG: TraV family lipoprotein [Gammaproteobacteria bacterium]|nr:TraV family lipoprotein [Gammaproteobacteria bacterium]